MSWLTEGTNCWLAMNIKQVLCVLVVGWHWHCLLLFVCSTGASGLVHRRGKFWLVKNIKCSSSWPALAWPSFLFVCSTDASELVH